MNHTKGPWTINGGAIESEKSILAHVYDCDEGGPDEFAANARLIAAAPDLLAACARVLDVLDKRNMDAPWEQAQRAVLRAAIAKAKGDEKAAA